MTNFKFIIGVVNYNNEKNVNRCLNSILSQTYSNFEVYVVDSGSTDNSLSIINNFKSIAGDKLNIINLKNNLGAGFARNQILRVLPDDDSFDYFWFIDADDYIISQKSLELIAKSLEKNNLPDILRLGFIDHNISKNISTKKCDQSNSINTFLANGLAPWRMVVKSKFKNTRFTENAYIASDVAWSLQIIDSISTHAVLTEPIIYYNRSIRNISIINFLPCINHLKTLSFNKKECNNKKRDFISRYNCNISTKEKIISTKQISIDDLFNNSLMISIDDERFNLVNTIFSDYSLPSPKKIEGIKDKNCSGPVNCLRSHRKAVMYAKEHNLPYVLIFEDDAYPCNLIIDKLKLICDNFPTNINILILGWSQLQQRNKQPLSSMYNKIQTLVSGSHAYIIFKSGYDEYLELTKKINVTADGILSKNKCSYIFSEPIFIQYSPIKSMNGHKGYILYGDHPNPPIGFKACDY